LQVRISYFGEAGGVPVGRAMLYITCVGKLGGGHPQIVAPVGMLPPSASLSPQRSRWMLTPAAAEQ